MQTTTTKTPAARKRFVGRWISKQSVLTAALLCSSFLFSACASESPSERAEAVGGVTAAQVINNPNAYVGKTVTVSGDVEEIHSPRAFNMDSGASVGELLVLGREPFPQVPDGGNRGYVINDTATVTGTVRMLVTAEIERELGWDLMPEIEAEFNAKPVLIVQQVGFRPTANSRGTNSANMTSNMNANANMNANTSMNEANNNQPLTDLSAIISAQNKQSLVGRRVQLDDVKVQKVIGERGFWLGEADNRMFARLDQRLNQGSAEWDVVIKDGQTRTLTGELRELPSMDEIRGWGLVSEADAKTLQDRGYYIHVESLKDTRRPIGR